MTDRKDLDNNAFYRIKYQMMIYVICMAGISTKYFRKIGICSFRLAKTGSLIDVQ
jgi:hypothetical protein